MRLKFCDYITKKRKQLGISREKLAERMEIPYPTLRGWELGIAEPPKYIQRWYKKDLLSLLKEDMLRNLKEAEEDMEDTDEE